MRYINYMNFVYINKLKIKSLTIQLFVLNSILIIKINNFKYYYFLFLIN